LATPYATALRRQPQLTAQDPHDRRPGSVPAFGPVLLQLGNHGGEAIGGQTDSGYRVTRALAMATGNLRQRAANRCRFEVAKKFPGSLRMPSYSRRPALPDLHAGGSQMDEPLNEPGFGGRAAQGVPKAFPSLVSLPIKAPVEEIQGEAPFRGGGERGGQGMAPGHGIGRQA